MIADKARDYYDRQAKERQIRKPADSVVETVPQQKGKACDQAGKTAGVSGETMDRLCGCGAALPKGKRFCDTCRTENRRRTKRRYMQSYRKQRSPAGERGCPFQCSPTPLAAENIENAAR